jgi:glutamate transport system permease protein
MGGAVTVAEANVLFDAPGPRAMRRYRMTAVATVIGIIAVIALVTWKLYIEDQLTAEKWEPFVTPSIIELLIEGLVDTLRAAAIAIAGAMVFGVIFGVAKLSDHRAMAWPAWLVVEFFRAVPLLLLIIFIWGLQGTQTGLIMPLVLGLILYNGSVLAEVFRAGINAVPKGQSEASYAIGMRKNQVMRIVLLPQAIKIMLPAIISQCIVALKDTSLGYVILAPGLTFVGREIWREFDNRLATAIVLAIIYILLNLILSWLAEYLQKRMGTPKVDLVGGIVQTQPDAGASGAGAPGAL